MSETAPQPPTDLRNRSSKAEEAAPAEATTTTRRGQIAEPEASTSQRPRRLSALVSGRQTKRNVLTTYALLLSGLVVTAVAVSVLMRVESLRLFVRDHFVVTMVATSLLMTVNTNLFNRMPYRQRKCSKMLTWVLHCVLVAIPMLGTEPEVAVRGVMYTTVLCFILSLKAFIVPETVTEAFLVPIQGIHVVVLVCTALNILLGFVSGTLGSVVSVVGLQGGFIVYSGLLICNTQRLCLNAKRESFDPMFSAFVFYMNVLNLYSRVIVLISNRYCTT